MADKKTIKYFDQEFDFDLVNKAATLNIENFRKFAIDNGFTSELADKLVLNIGSTLDRFKNEDNLSFGTLGNITDQSGLFTEGSNMEKIKKRTGRLFKKYDYDTEDLNKWTTYFLNQVLSKGGLKSITKKEEMEDKPSDNTYDAKKHSINEFLLNMYRSPRSIVTELDTEGEGDRVTTLRFQDLGKLLAAYYQEAQKYDTTKDANIWNDNMLTELKDLSERFSEYSQNPTDLAVRLKRIGMNDDYITAFTTKDRASSPVVEKSAVELRKEEDAKIALEEADEEYLFNSDVSRKIKAYLKDNPSYENNILGAIPLSTEDTDSLINMSLAYLEGLLGKNTVTTHDVTDFLGDLRNVMEGGDTNKALKREDYLKYAIPLLTSSIDKLYLHNGMIRIPNTEDFNSYTYLGYNPSTGEYGRYSMVHDTNGAFDDIIRKYFKKLVQEKEEGGILEYQYGGVATLILKRNQDKKKSYEALRERAKKSGLTTVEGLKKKEQKINSPKDLTTEDYVRLASIIPDLAGAVAAYVPGYGTAASGVSGLVGTFMNLGADISDESVSGWDAAKNFGILLAGDVAGLIPGWGTAAKMSSIAKIIKPVYKGVAATFAGMGLLGAVSSLDNLMAGKATREDYQNLLTGFQTLLGGAGYAGGAKKLRDRTSSKDMARVTTSTGNKATITKDLLDALRAKSGLEELNKFFKSLTGEELQREFKKRTKTNWFPSKPVTEKYTEISLLSDDDKYLNRIFKSQNLQASPTLTRTVAKESEATQGVSEEWLKKIGMEKLGGTIDKAKLSKYVNKYAKR